MASKGSILVVDDDQAITGLIQAVLTKEGYEVEVASNGVEGVQKAREKHPDLILMDITMPEMNGYEATELLKEIESVKETPVIFLTGKSASDDAGKSFAHGGATFVRKPFTPQQLKDLVLLAMESVRSN